MTYFPNIATRRTVLLEVTPSITLQAWTLHSGSAYKVTLSPWFEGMYRRVAGVRQNATDLTEAASIAAVISTAGTYFWDSANSLLYVRATTGSIEDTIAQCFVTYFIATDAVVINQTDDDPSSGIFYEPWLRGNLPRLTRQISDLLFGITVWESGNVSFTNGHGTFHYLVPSHNWKNKRAVLLLGEYENTPPNRSDFVEIVTMLIEDVAANEDNAAFKLVSIQRTLEKEIPSTRYSTDNYPNIGEGVSGSHKMLGYGRATIRPDLTDESGNGVYTIADAAYQTLFAVHSVTAIAKTGGARTLLTLTTHYTVDLTLCTVTLTGTGGYVCDDYIIECDVTGKPDGAGSYLNTFGQIVKDILTTHLGVPTTQLDLASFTQADIDNNHPLSVWLKVPRSIASVFSSSEPNKASLEKSVLGTVRQTLDGKWNVRIWNDSTPAPTVSLVKEDFVSFLPEPKIENVTSVAAVYFNQNLSANSWSVKTAEDLRARYLFETREETEFYTFLRDADDAETLAQRAALLLAATSIDVEFELRGSQLAEALAGDFVTVSYAPAPVVGQAFEEANLELQRLDISLAPTLKLSGRFNDFRSIGSRIGHWTEDTAADWASASDAEKASQGFWSDDDGLIDPSDPTTANLSLWW